MSADEVVLSRKKLDVLELLTTLNLLTRQTVENSATIYSLVTNESYYRKPTKENYDQAFSQLTVEIKKKNFKTLIYSQ